ncbi:MAG: threonylcarbamoyl-AMP synthase [Candidatus Kerfeldbacteria bacterium RIFCSPHIGHO2_12_FULL_48_17]|uniref:L-threonylcarbamoyladenylate synthase n=1 Tax=Candidatus Kerfeldbacteria bacterium RIFCSPHIGHO2_12_FULL_48_17 TaxID=1798542 RepID=A0A1G2B0F5_9BACT|nr:MAG: threonylcarbamoyl-AMP synthase [Candidatus Kerfeldbacteria bacterium RIFCSPHIGHO2_12_FULL_48_17]
MQIIRIDIQKPSPSIIRQAARILKAGGVVAHATETAYGLAACATDPKAVKRINQLKGRPQNKHLSVIVSDLAMAEKYARFTPQARTLAQKYWPGPLTLILHARKNMPRQLTPDNTIGLRVPGSKLARALVKAAGEPLISTSANLAGQPNPYSARRVKKDFAATTTNATAANKTNTQQQPDLILDGGHLPHRRPSTIINLTTTPPRIERQGTIHINLDHVF